MCGDFQWRELAVSIVPAAPGLDHRLVWRWSCPVCKTLLRSEPFRPPADMPPPLEAAHELADAVVAELRVECAEASVYVCVCGEGYDVQPRTCFACGRPTRNVLPVAQVGDVAS